MLENSRWKVVACGEASLACRAAAQGAAYPQMGMYLVNSRMGKTRASYCRRTLFQKLGACDSVYGTVHCPVDLSIKLPFFFYDRAGESAHLHRHLRVPVSDCVSFG